MGNVSTHRRARTGYRVDIKSLLTGNYFPYTPSRGIDRAMAESLAEHVKRGGSAGRLVETPSEKVLDEWESQQA